MMVKVIRKARGELQTLRADRSLLRSELGQWRRKRGQPLADYTRAYVRQFGRDIAAGPFTGMRLTRRGTAMAEDVVAKLLGAYETELTAVTEEAIERRPAIVVNIGAGEGYYAVGFARRCPAARVLAFDVDALRRLWCARMAGANGVGDRVEVRGVCDPSALEQALAGRPSAVVCDCEGNEADVIDPARTPSLSVAFVVIEVHDFVDQLIGPALERALEATHEIEWIYARQRWRNDYPRLTEVPGFDYMHHDLAVDEFRPEQMRWLIARPRP